MLRIKTDKLLHALSGACLMFALCLWFRHWQGALLAFGVGVLKEVIDIFRGTGFDVRDLMADITGILIAWSVLWLSTCLVF